MGVWIGEICIFESCMRLLLYDTFLWYSLDLIWVYSKKLYCNKVAAGRKEWMNSLQRVMLNYYMKFHWIAVSYFMSILNTFKVTVRYIYDS
jgi:hypothetical protein